MTWNNDLALRWTKMVGPSRPTISEIAVYQKYVVKLKKFKKRKLKMLVLGSTPEFRDWGYEQNIDVTVIDSMYDYHNTINRELRHKDIFMDSLKKEDVVVTEWQNMKFTDEFDLIVGDLIIGNIPPDELEQTIINIKEALKEDGLFLQKSFYYPKKYKKMSSAEVVRNYYMNPSHHPYSYLTFDIAMNIIDENYMVDFNKLFLEFVRLNSLGILDDETMLYFNDLGYQNHMKFKFHMIPLQEYENLISKHLEIYNVEYGNEVYSQNFPLHIIGKRKSRLFGGM